MTKKVVDLRFAKKRKSYLKTLETIQETGKCPFCPENFLYHKKPVLNKNGGWIITQSSWPYPNAKYHFLLIPEKHKEELGEFDSSDLGAILKLANWVIEKYKIKGGGLSLRFGDSLYTGASVCHLHFHLLVPKIDKKRKKAKAVYFGIG